MIVGDWAKITASLTPETPVIFYNSCEKPLESDRYCEGAAVKPSRLWDAKTGWVPCVLVVLGEEC